MPTLLQSWAVEQSKETSAEPPLPSPAEAAAELEWSFNPWRNASGPRWRRPYVALIVSLAVCALFGFALTYPSYSVEQLQLLEQMTTDQSLTEEKRGEITEQLTALTSQRQNWPWQMASWGGIAFVMLIGMTAMLYLPVRYRLDADGVTVYFLGVPNLRKWGYYRNFYSHDTGVHLTTMPKPSGLDPFRGHFLQFNNNRTEVLAFIKVHMTLRGEPTQPG